MFFFFSSRRRHTRWTGDWSSDVCSSDLIAAYGAMDEGHGAMHTLYGAYKYCDEQIAKVYSGDWGIHSLGIRPGVVYGVGRDQGLTSKTTVAILAAAAGKPYEVPFSGG